MEHDETLIRAPVSAELENIHDKIMNMVSSVAISIYENNKDLYEIKMLIFNYIEWNSAIGSMRTNIFHHIDKIKSNT